MGFVGFPGSAPEVSLCDAKGIALYSEYLCLLSRCCASLREAAFPRDPMTDPLTQKTQVVFPALSIPRSPLRPSRTPVHLGWLAGTLRTTAEPSACSRAALRTVVPEHVPLASLPRLEEERKYAQSPSEYIDP